MRHTYSGGKMAISVLVLITVIAFYLFANSPFFETGDVEWTGLVYLDSGQLDAYLDFPCTNVWRMDTGELELVLGDHPWIQTASVSWRWPNRVIVLVEERVPLAQVPSSTGWFLLDGEGNLLPPTQGGVVYPLPIVTNLDLESGELLLATSRLLTMIPSSLKTTVSEWNVQTRSFVSRSGTEIVFGAPEDLEEKFLLWERILDDLAANSQRAQRIDLRVPKNPVVTIL